MCSGGILWDGNWDLSQGKAMKVQTPDNLAMRQQCDFRAACYMQVSEVKELRGATYRQDAEVRQLREENRGLAQKAALASTLGADCASLQQRVSTESVTEPGLCFPLASVFLQAAQKQGPAVIAALAESPHALCKAFIIFPLKVWEVIRRDMKLLHSRILGEVRLICSHLSIAMPESYSR